MLFLSAHSLGAPVVIAQCIVGYPILVDEWLRPAVVYTG